MGGATPQGTGKDGDSTPGTGSKSGPTPKTPVGVVVVEDGAHASGMEMNKLLRQSRYFDEDFEGTALRCFRCGGTGHTSRECKKEARQKPCILCAQFGHMRSECPQALCFKCKRPGHVSRDCPNGSKTMQQDQPCLRCGSRSCSCAGQADYIRAYGGCTAKYNKSDVALVRCYVCYSHGHLTCKQTPKSVPEVTCYNCGQAEHPGGDCWEERPPAVRGEQAELARAQHSMMSHRWNSSGGSMDAGHRYSGSNGMREVWYDQPAYDDWEGGGYHQRGGGGGGVWDRMQPAADYGRHHGSSHGLDRYVEYDQHDHRGQYSGHYDGGSKRRGDYDRNSYPPQNKHTRFY
mmetsp:Transcript_12313/g.34577  ORF Transcript_12313/g.34577 Transcript_12313/m.34577 type:complete len:346 (+) Transcript_12313:371-1408(+)